MYKEWLIIIHTCVNVHLMTSRCRLTKPIFKTPFRKGSINDSSEVNPSQHGSFTSNTRGAESQIISFEKHS